MPLYRGSRRLTMVRHGSNYDSSAQAWFNAVVAAGGTVSAAQKGYVNTLITSLKAHSLWTVQDRVWLHAAENTQQALIDIVSLVTATAVSSPTFTANQGYAGDGATSYVDTGFTTGSNYAQNSASISVYIRTSRASNGNMTALGRFDAATTGTQDIIYPLAASTITYDVNNPQFSNQPANTNAQGFWTASRTGSGTMALYKNSNSTAFNTATTASQALAQGAKFFVLARSVNDVAGLFTTDEIAITTIGAGMSAANVAQFQTDLNAYMTSLGTNVY